MSVERSESGPNIRRSRWRRPLAAAAIIVGFIGAAGAGTTHAAPLTDDGWTTSVTAPTTVARGEVVTLDINVTAATTTGRADRPRGLQPQQQRPRAGTRPCSRSGTPARSPPGETTTLQAAVDGARRRADQRPLGEGRRVQAGLGRALPLERRGDVVQRDARRPTTPEPTTTVPTTTAPTPTTAAPTTTTSRRRRRRVRADDDDADDDGSDDDAVRRPTTTTTVAPTTTRAAPTTHAARAACVFSESFADPTAFDARFDHGWSGEVQAGSAVRRRCERLAGRSRRQLRGAERDVADDPHRCGGLAAGGGAGVLLVLCPVGIRRRAT